MPGDGVNYLIRSAAARASVHLKGRADYPDNITAAAVAVAVQQSGMVKSHQTLLLTAEDMNAALKTHIDYRPPDEG